MAPDNGSDFYHVIVQANKNKQVHPELKAGGACPACYRIKIDKLLVW